MSKWTKKDSAERDGTSVKEVSRAEHEARKDAYDAGVHERGNDSKNSQPFSRDDESGEQATGFWESIFGSKK